MTLSAAVDRSARWLGRQVVRDQSARLRLEERSEEWQIRQRFAWRRWRSGHVQRRAADRVLQDMWRRLHPRSLAQGALIRVGGDRDGGYVMAEVGDPGTVVSIGVGDDNSADLWFAERGWRVVEWDPTVAAPPVTHPDIAFHALGLGPAVGDRRLTLTRIVEASQVTGTAILMVDIEGDECLTDVGMTADALACFEQIVIELHDLSRVLEPDYRARLITLLDALLAEHEVIHVHANNCAPLYWINGVPLPDVLEVSLVARSLVTGELVDHDLPTPLDRPNDPTVRDHALSLSRIAATCQGTSA